MKPVLSKQKFVKTLFWLTTIFLSTHILLGSLCIFFKDNFLPKKINWFYSNIIVLGPFFQQDRITMSPHLNVSFFSKTDGWSPFRDMAKENVLDFQQHPWRYEKLKWSNYEHHILRKASGEIHALKYLDGSEGKASAELLRYVHSQNPLASDSIKLVYTRSVWQPKIRSFKVDTAFNVIFKPTKSGAPK
jgi:hypothetical protein